jgi:UDP-N-acetylglucosamine diphosphorylase / glucose-1-phosphate thymidylyltransferase / UDP-N-acetylgalactosamine diphosphorylase / glucosamine-1-phosphate N-acetyltransferase / galactosamine-1-phosphate N-acetyltransferase
VTRRLWLVEDEEAARWHPFSLTRPVGELLFGTCLLRERTARAVGLPVAGTLAPAALEGFTEEGTPPVVTPDAVPLDEPRILISSRVAFPLSGSQVERVRAALASAPDDRVSRLTVDGRGAGWLLPPGRTEPGDAGPRPPGIALPGRILDAPWALVAWNAAEIRADLAAAPPGTWRLVPDAGVTILGDHAVTRGEGAVAEPGSVLDAREGPIHLSERVRVGPFTHLRGPAFIGRGTTLLGGSIGAVSIGPECKVRGEVEETVIVGYTNKAHDGYLGHAVVGRWVNLGAFTTNSDLKNDYGPVRVPRGAGDEVDTGLLKVGVFLGDHVKTGIGTLLNTGSVVGAGSNVFGGAMPPKWVPPFSWGAGSELAPFRLEAFLETAEKAMARREMTLTPGLRAFLSGAWERSSGSRGTGP